MLRDMWLCAFALASVVIFAGSKTATHRVKESDTAADIQAINGLREQFGAAYSSHDAAAVAACFADDAVLIFPNHPDIECRQAVQAKLEAYFRESPTAIKHTPLKTHVARDWAIERGNSIEIVTPKFGKTIENSIKCLVTLKSGHDSSWKVYRDMSNKNLKEPT